MKRDPRTQLRAASAALLALGLASGAARADDTVMCLEEARGVPRTSGAPPEWDSYSAAAGTTALEPLGPEDDPGWTQAAQNGHGEAVNFARSRLIYDVDSGNNVLYLMFVSELATSGTATGQLWVGLASGGTSTVLRFDINNPIGFPVKRQIPCFLCPGGSAGFGYRLYQGTAAPFPQLPDAAQTGSTWVDADVWNRSSDYVVLLKLPLVNLFPSNPSTIDFWYEFDTVEGGVNQVNAKWPFNSTNASLDSTTGITPPAFGTLKLGTGDPDCRAGVFIDRNDVGVARTASGALTHRIVGYDSSSGTDGDNFFVARPEHTSGTLPPGLALEARFRIADWGSSGPGAFDSVHTKTGDAQQWIGPISGGQIASGDWQLSPTERCDYNIGVANDAGVDDGCSATGSFASHQCVLTEIRSTATGPATVPILEDSVYINTNFVDLSTFERVASIGAQGILAPAGATKLDYYLYVDRRHLAPDYRGDPAKDVGARLSAIAKAIRTDYSPPDEQVAPLRDRAKRGDEKAAAELKKLEEATLRGMPKDTAARLEQIESVLAEMRKSKHPLDAVSNLDLDLVEQVMPAMLVHVFRDSGREVQRGDKKRRVLLPQNGFGYYARHEGQIVGWEAVIDGAEPLGDDWYRVRVPPDGATKIRTRIQAVEANASRLKPDTDWKPPDEGCPEGKTCREAPHPCPKRNWWIFIVLGLALVVAFGLGIVLERRRRS